MHNPFDDKIGEERMKVCKQCEHIVAGTICGVCGCILFFKTRFKETECPIKKWK